MMFGVKCETRGDFMWCGVCGVQHVTRYVSVGRVSCVQCGMWDGFLCRV